MVEKAVLRSRLLFLTPALFVRIFVQNKGGVMSQAITYSEARQNLAETMSRVCDHHEPVIITRQK